MTTPLDRLLKTLSAAPPEEIHPEQAAAIGRLVGCDPRIVATELGDVLEACRKGRGTKYAIWLIGHALGVAENEGD